LFAANSPLKSEISKWQSPLKADAMVQAVKTLSQVKRETAKPSKPYYMSATTAHIELAREAGKQSGTIVKPRLNFHKVRECLRDAKVVIGDATYLPIGESFSRGPFQNQSCCINKSKCIVCFP
jgi:hypothetical protein